MLKTAGALLLALLLSGVGLTLVLPKYTPDGANAPAFQLLESSLQQPVDEATYRASTLAFDTADDEAPPRGLQLSLHGSLAAAQSAAQQLALQQLELPMLPTIFKTVHDMREWYVLALGPLGTADEAAYLATVLQDQDLRVQTIAWPATPPPAQDAPQ